MEARVRLSHYAYVAIVWLFIAGILTQVFLIGLSLLGGQPGWRTHISLGHGLAGLVLLMVVLAYTGRLPRPMKPLTWLNCIVYILLADVVVFMRASAPLVAALHPVLAVLLFGIAGFLAIRAWQLVHPASNSMAISQLEAEAIGD